MDTSILETLFEIAPDLMEEIELRMLVLERVAALEPIGRRALAQRLHLPEREVRSAADALRTAGCITQSAAGMEMTARGRELVETARAVSRGRRSLSAMELALSRKLGVERVCVVRGDADRDESVLAEAAETAARQVRFLLQDARVLAVSGGQMMRMTAEAVSLAAPADVTVVPAQGGVSGPMALQANAVAEVLAGRLGGQCRLLHLPQGISQQAVEELSRVPQVREALELLRHADVLLYGVNRAQEQARVLGTAERETLERSGAAAEALGVYVDAQGKAVGGHAVLRAQDVDRHVRAAAVAVGRGSAEAILAVCAHRVHRLLVTDEGAAVRMLELLRE
ncbi:MAG: sugar-binding domain-containing protein [Candidatus Ventricola sp.]